MEDLGQLDLTTQVVNFDEIGADLDRFQSDPIVKSALERGVDLRQYSRQIDRDLQAAEKDSVTDYLGQVEHLAKLNKEINTCDGALEKMQTMLLGFQSDLGGISEDIKHLQENSVGMSTRLRNRRALGVRLNAFLDNVAIPQSLIDGICEEDLSESYLSHLVQLNMLLEFAKRPANLPIPLPPAPDGDRPTWNQTIPPGDEPETDGTGDAAPPAPVQPKDFVIGEMAPRDTQAVRETLPVLEKVKARAVQRIRGFLLAQIAELKKSKSNVQMLQQKMLKYKFFNTFLNDHSPSTAEEIQQLYTTTMSKVLQNLFKTYHSHLLRLQKTIATKHSLIAVEDGAASGLFAPKADVSKSSDTFALGDRDEIMKEPDAPPIVIHVAQAEKQQLPYEAIFRSVQKHLMDSATSEFLFTVDFFNTKSHSLFQQIYEKTIATNLDNLESYLGTCYDAVAVLIMIQIAHAHRHTMQRRRIPCLDNYFDKLNLLLWPKFKVIFDSNLMSVSAADPKKLGKLEHHVHPVTRRYSDFTISIAALHKQFRASGLADERMGHNLNVLRENVGGLLVKLSQGHVRKKAQMIFLLNNYHHVVQTHHEQNLSKEPDAKYFQELLAQQQHAFVEEELRESYGSLVEFVKVAEPLLQKCKQEGADPKIKMDLNAMGNIASEFNKDWKNGIKRINQSVLCFFSNFINGMDILKKLLTQLLLYYTRFQDIVKTVYSGGDPPFAKEIVPVHSIIYEIKKYSRTF